MPDSTPFQSFRNRIDGHKGSHGKVPPNNGGGTVQPPVTPPAVEPTVTPPAIDPSGIVNPPIWQDTPHAMTGYTGTAAEPLATQQLMALINARANSQWKDIPKATYTPTPGSVLDPAQSQATMYDELVKRQQEQAAAAAAAAAAAEAQKSATSQTIWNPLGAEGETWTNYGRPLNYNSGVWY